MLGARCTGRISRERRFHLAHWSSSSQAAHGLWTRMISSIPRQSPVCSQDITLDQEITGIASIDVGNYQISPSRTLAMIRPGQQRPWQDPTSRRKLFCISLSRFRWSRCMNTWTPHWRGWESTRGWMVNRSTSMTLMTTMMKMGMEVMMMMSLMEEMKSRLKVKAIQRWKSYFKKSTVHCSMHQELLSTNKISKIMNKVFLVQTTQQKRRMNLMHPKTKPDLLVKNLWSITGKANQEMGLYMKMIGATSARSTSG